ncbi:MAG: efflux RND transporter periplasmic adaptor subunit [Pseudomonadota bacterium]
MKRKSKRILLVVGIFAGSVVGMMTLMSMRPEQPKREVENLDPLVEVIELEVSTESFRIQSQGTVQARTQTVLSAEVSGAVVSISPKFIPGGVFAKDEVLMRIDPTSYKVALDRAEALVAQRQIEFDGAKKLRSQGYRAEAELASSAAALASAKADLVDAQKNLDRTNIRLPYEGMVLSKSADLGQFVNPGTQIGETFATDLAEVRLPLTDHDLAFVDIPDAVEITRTGSANGPAVTLQAIQRGRLTEWQAQIVRSEGVVDERSRVTYVVAQIDDPYSRHKEGPWLPVGTFVSASIEGSQPVDLIKVPRSALRGSDQLLFVTDESTLEIRSVGVLRADSDYAYISSGASAGERITTTVIQAPTTGMAVRTEATTPSNDDDDVIASADE